MVTASHIASEPADGAYAAILDLAAATRSLAILVWRDQLDFSATANSLREALGPFRAWEKRTNRWPGTQIIGSSALAVAYRCTKEVVGSLLQAKRLYAWLAPDFPEDLAFVAPEGLALASVSHERDAWVLLPAWQCSLGIATSPQEFSEDEWTLFLGPEAAACEPVPER